MDNDKQVALGGSASSAVQAAPVTAAVEMFLKDELIPLSKQNKRNVYDLEAEYAKTKKNNSPFILLVLLACFLAVAFGALLAVAQIRQRDSRIAVSLDVFEDVNLKNLIDTVTRTQDMYEQAVKNLSSLQGSFNSRVSEAKLKLSSDIVVIESMKLSKKEAAKRKNAVTDVFNKSMADIHTEYDAQLESAEKEVTEYKNRLAEYDNAKVKSAQEKDKALDSERKLQSLERQKLTDAYEKRIKKLESSISDIAKRSSKDKEEAVLSVAKKYNIEIDGLNNTIAERDATIVEKDAVIAERDETIVKKDEDITNLTGQVNSLTDKYNTSQEVNAQVSESLDTLLTSRGIEAVVMGVIGGKLRLYVTRQKAQVLPAFGVTAAISYFPPGQKKSATMPGNITKENEAFIFTPLPDKNGNILDINVVPHGTTVTISK